MNSNNPKHRPSARLLAIFALFLPLYVLPPNAIANDISLPDLGDESANILSPAQERKIGQEFIRHARRQWNINDDLELTAYLNNVGQQLVRQADAATTPFHFFAVNDKTINAFAVPGGYIGVHVGLILAATREAELAGVLAHEVAHITQRHIPRMVAEAQHTQGPTIAAIIAAILLAGANPAGGQALATIGSAAYAQNQLNFSRGFEHEADRTGIGFLAKAGFDPQGMPAFFERLQAWNRLNDTNLPEFLRTHPITSARISEARARAERYRAENPHKDSDEFAHIQARLRAQQGSAAEAEREFAQRLQNAAGTEMVERYGYTLTLLRKRAWRDARREAQRLMAAAPAQIFYRTLAADIELAAGNPLGAIKIYQDSPAAQRNSPLLRSRYADALLEANRPQQAREVLAALVREQPENPSLGKRLARAAGAAGNTIEAHRALAEHYYINGDSDAALAQLAIAHKLAGDNFYLRAGIDARTNEIKSERPLEKKQ